MRIEIELQWPQIGWELNFSLIFTLKKTFLTTLKILIFKFTISRTKAASPNVSQNLNNTEDYRTIENT